MRHIQLNDQLYQEAQLRATEAGFPSVDEYVADVLLHDLHEETDDLEHFFTAERLAQIDRSADEINAGQGIDSEKAHEYFRRKRDA